MVSGRLRSFFFFFLARFSKFRLSTMDLDVQRPLGRDLLGRVFVGTWQPSPSSFTTLLVSFPRSEPEFRFSFYSSFFPDISLSLFLSCCFISHFYLCTVATTAFVCYFWPTLIGAAWLSGISASHSGRER